MLTVKTAAKLNLVLDITGLRADGYHTVRTVMQSVGLYDFLTLDIKGKGIRLTGNLPYIPYDGRNLVCKAALSFYASAGIAPRLEMRLTKHIPIQAGMGGGSANAAGVLMGLNELHGNPLSQDDLCRVAASLGADVPFFLHGGTALCEGIGQIVTPLAPLPDCAFVIVKDRQGMSSPDAYARYDAAKAPRRADVQAMLSAIESGELGRVCGALDNVFYDIVAERIGRLSRTVQELRARGAMGVCMTGSGSAVYGVFPDRDAARACLKFMKKRHMFAAAVLPAVSAIEFFSD